MSIVKAVPRQMFPMMTASIGNRPSQSTGPKPSACKPVLSDPDGGVVGEACVEGPKRGPDEEEREEECCRRQAREVGAVPAERDDRGGAGAKSPRSDRRVYSRSFIA